MAAFDNPHPRGTAPFLLRLDAPGTLMGVDLGPHPDRAVAVVMVHERATGATTVQHIPILRMSAEGYALLVGDPRARAKPAADLVLLPEMLGALPQYSARDLFPRLTWKQQLVAWWVWLRAVVCARWRPVGVELEAMLGWTPVPALAAGVTAGAGVGWAAALRAYGRR